MIQLARSFTPALIGVVATGFSWGLFAQREMLAADDANAGRSWPPALPAQFAGESPSIVLSRGGPQRTGSVSGSRLPEHPVVQWTTRILEFPG